MGGRPPGTTDIRIDRLFAKWSRSDSPGCSLGVSWNGKVVYQRGYGIPSLELGCPDHAVARVTRCIHTRWP